MPRRGDSNEYPQHLFLWRTNENFPWIIMKYPPYLFHWIPTISVSLYDYKLVYVEDVPIMSCDFKLCSVFLNHIQIITEVVRVLYEREKCSSLQCHQLRPKIYMYLCVSGFSSEKFNRYGRSALTLYFILISYMYMSQRMGLWYLSHRRPVKPQAILGICTVSPEPSLTWRMEVDKGSDQNFRHLAPLDGCTCTFEEWVYGERKVP